MHCRHSVSSLRAGSRATRRPKIPKSERMPPTFYEQDTMRHLIHAASEIDTRTHALILLRLHAGPRAVISGYADTPKSDPSSRGQQLAGATRYSRGMGTPIARKTARSTSRTLLAGMGPPSDCRRMSSLWSVAICSHFRTDASETPPSPRRSRT